ncbi:MAG: hypothetical protein WAV78_04485 [Xanthobacteraceae bacterium]
MRMRIGVCATCRKCPTVLVLALSFLASPALAASLTLGCSGTVTTTSFPKGGVAGDAEKESIVDWSVAVDPDERTVSGFWAELNGVHSPLPIITVDANGVTFRANKKEGASQYYIQGTVDRITAKVDVVETIQWSNGGMTTKNWDLRCKPTKPLF